MSNNPAFWSSVGFWILMVGLIGDLVIIFVPSGRTEKILATIFTLLIAIGVTVEHVADAKRFSPWNIDAEQQKNMVRKLVPFAGQAAVVWMVYGESEVQHIAVQIGKVLQRAEWNARVTGPGLSDGAVELEGIIVKVRMGADRLTKDAAQILVTSLVDASMPVRGPLIVEDRELEAPIMVMVGKR